MAVQAQYGGVPAACFYGGDLSDAEAKYGKLFATVPAPNNGVYNCATRVASGGAQSDLTACNNGAAGGSFASRKRGMEAVEQYVSSSSVLLPIPAMMMTKPAAADRFVESAMTSTSGRPAVAAFADALVSELYYKQDAEIDAIVRTELDRTRDALEQARKRQCQSLLRAASATAARRLREKEAELEAARLCTARLEERLRQAAAESQAWHGLARSNEAVAASLRATLDHLLVHAAPAPAEGFGESDYDDAQSYCFEAKEDAGGPYYKWACRSCGGQEASVLLLPCRHLCLCKACEPKLDACPVCLAAKNASVHIAMN